MALIFTEQTNKVSLDEIINFESKVKILLPKDYKDFLLKYNGGVLENNEYKIYLPPEKNKKRGKNLYFSIWSLERLDSLLELFEDKILIIDNRMLSIGDLDGGGIYISVSGHDYGVVYFALQYYIGMYYLIEDKYIKAANNFDEFVSKIKTID